MNANLQLSFSMMNDVESIETETMTSVMRTVISQTGLDLNRKAGSQAFSFIPYKFKFGFLWF